MGREWRRLRPREMGRGGSVDVAGWRAVGESGEAGGSTSDPSEGLLMSESWTVL